MNHWIQKVLHILFLSPCGTGCTSSTHKGHNLPTPLTLLRTFHGVILITKVLILSSCRVPFIQDPFPSQPDKLNLLQPDSPVDFTACFVYSTSCLCLADGGSDKWHESRAAGVTTITYSIISCPNYKFRVVQTGTLEPSATCKADYVRHTCD